MTDLVVVGSEVRTPDIADLNQFRRSSGHSWGLGIQNKEHNLLNVFVSSDGTKMYVLLFGGGGATDQVAEFDLEISGKIETAVDTGVRLDLTSSTQPNAVTFNDAGDRMYIWDSINNLRLTQYNLSVAWDLSTAVFEEGIRIFGSSIQNGIITPDGLKVIRNGRTSRIDQTPLTTPNDITSVDHVRVILQEPTEGGDSFGQQFNDDGTKWYKCSSTDGTVYQYSLSPAYDLSSASYDSKSFDFSNETGNGIWGIFFKADGLKVYIMDEDITDIFQYTLSTAYDISTASYDSKSISMPSIGDSYQFFISPDGTNLFTISDYVPFAIYGWTLSVAWDISTATQNLGTFVLSDKPGTNLGFGPNSVWFNSSGTVCLIGDWNTGDVYKYTLTAWTVSTMSFSQRLQMWDRGLFALVVNSDGTEFSAIGGDGFFTEKVSTGFDFTTQILQDQFFSKYNGFFDDVRGFVMSPDGTKFVVLNDQNQTTYPTANAHMAQYVCSTPFDITTATFDTEYEFPPINLTPEYHPESLQWNEDGSKLMIRDGTMKTMDTYHCPKPYDITNIQLPESIRGSVKLSTVPGIIIWKPDGTLFLFQHLTGNRIEEWLCPIKFSFRGAVLGNNMSVSGQTAQSRGFFMKTDGTKLYLVDDTGDSIRQYGLSTPWDINSGSYDSINQSVSGQTSDPNQVWFRADGKKMYLKATNGGNLSVLEYDLGTAWLLSSLSFVQAKNTEFIVKSNSGIWLSDDGTRIYLTGGGQFMQGELTTPWDVSTITFPSMVTRTENNTFTNLTMSDDGTKTYFLGSNGNDTVYQYDLTTAFDIFTGSYASKSEDLSTINASIKDISMQPDGDRIYFLGITTNQRIYQGDLSTPNDLSTFAFTAGEYLDVSSETTTPRAFFIKPDGTKIYVIDEAETIYQYTMSTPWDIETATYDTVTSGVLPQFTMQNGGMAFSEDGLRLFVHANGELFPYTLSVAWDLSTIVYDQTGIKFGASSSTDRGLHFSPDGLNYYVLQGGSDGIRQHKLTTAYDIMSGDDTGLLTEPYLDAGPISFAGAGMKYLYTSTSTEDMLVRFERLVQKKSWGN